MRLKHYAVWHCLPSEKGTSEKAKPGCGCYNIMKTYRVNGNRTNKWQGKCPKCGKKKNLKPSCTTIYPTREEAEAYIDHLINGGGWF